MEARVRYKKGGIKKKKKEMGEAPYLGSLPSGAPDLEGKNRKKEKRNKRVIKKARAETKSIVTTFDCSL